MDETIMREKCDELWHDGVCDLMASAVANLATVEGLMGAGGKVDILDCIKYLDLANITCAEHRATLSKVNKILEVRHA